ncbi:hypothetical protein F4604DRAFT_1918588 [Suillus subluteus]|nr:hypothetical protein F4604DRAFT_1918588 [Suillus subluteus]
MASSASSRFVRHGRYQIPVDIWGVMQEEYNSTMEGSDIQIGSDLSGSTKADWSVDGEVSATDPNMTRLSEIRKGVKIIGAQALKHDDEIEQWLITSNAKSGCIVLGMKRHNKGFKDTTSVNTFADGFKAGGGTPLNATVAEALDTYITKIGKDPNADALTLVFFLDGVDDSMTEALQNGWPVDLGPLKKLVMVAAAQIRKSTKCTDVREKLGVQFCLVTSYSKVIDAYSGFDDATMYTDPETGEEFECDIFDCTTLKQIQDMGSWELPLTHMKLIGGARNATLDNMLEYLEKFALDYDPNGSAKPPSYDDYLKDLDNKQKAKA